MGQSEGTYEDYVIKKKLRKIFERLDIGVNPKKKKFKEAMKKVFEKHAKALSGLDD